jgi:hypothetical protein
MSLNADDVLWVSWTFLKAQFAVKPFRMGYTLKGDGTYQVYAVSQNLALGALLIDPADITDFTTNYQAQATAVTNAGEAIALALLPEVSQSVLSSQNSGRSFGYIGTSAVTSVTVRATVYTPPGNNAQRSFRSTNVNDAAAGTGARKVKLTYFDAAGNGPFEETVTLNGTTGVNTVATNIALVEKMEVVEVGSNGGNLGTIELRTGLAGAGTIIGSIAIGDNQTYWAHHYVPLGKKANILAIDGAASVAAGGMTLNSINPVNALLPQRALDVTTRHGTVHLQRAYSVPILVEGPAIVFLNERPDVVTASTMFAGFSWIQY